MLRFSAVLIACSAIGCGVALQAGERCSPEGGLSCESSTVALSCDDGVARAVPCKGGGGCISDGMKSVCAQQGVAGDPCLRSSIGKSQCDASNPDQLVSCTATGWVASPCHRCEVSGSSLSCQPYPGDPCSAENEGRGACDPSNSDQRVKCTNSVWVAETCNGCTASATAISCH